MRSIAKIKNHDEALLAGAHLVSNGVECKITQEQSGLSFLWVLQEDHQQRGRELLAQFMSDPNKDKYREAVEFARRLAQEQEAKIEAAEAKSVSFGQTRQRLMSMHLAPAPVTWMVISICCVIWGMVLVQPELLEQVFGWLQIAAPNTPFLQSILSGEIWRIFTPALLHAPLRLPDGDVQVMGLVHILFNMMMFRDLAGLVERRESGLKLFGLVLLFSSLPNLLQYYCAGPNFVGMSGVVFALVAYLWIRGKYDIRYGLRLNQGLVYSALIWFVFCLTLSNMANYVHAGGLALGALVGFVQSGYWKRWLRA